MIYINADEIQRVLGCSNQEAAFRAERQRKDCLKESRNFCFETVLSTDRNIKLLQEAKEKDYFIRCYYVLTVHPQINVYRVSSRVLAGGHDVPTDKIVSRYYKAMALVPELVSTCDICHIYDNSLDAPYRIFKKRKEHYWYCVEPHLWLKKDIVALTGIKNPEKAQLNKHH
jgi:predicted ABC-type ATPase